MTLVGATAVPLTPDRSTRRGPARPSLAAPGVSVEWVGPLLRQLESVRSDVAGFVGFARRGPVQRPLRISNPSEFDAVYGPPIAGAFLVSAVHGFFANGGDTCWVVRAADPSQAVPATFTTSSWPRMRFTATTAGEWANGLAVDVRPTGGEQFALSLQAIDGRREVWQNLQLTTVRDRLAGQGDHNTSASALVIVEVLDPADGAVGPTRGKLEGGSDGLATLTTGHLTGEGTEESGDRSLGAALLDDFDEVGLVCIPDLVLRQQLPRPTPPPAPPCPDALEASPVPPAPLPTEALPNFDLEQIAGAHAELVGRCEALHDRIALIQHPSPSALLDDVVQWRHRFDSAFGAIYWPWLQTLDPVRGGDVIAVPPCGHVAGIVARCDRAVGPHKPPANESAVGAVGMTVDVDDRSHGIANAEGINAFRQIGGRGLRLLGARTMDTTPAWRYLNVRRLVSQIERSATAYAEWLVFEPNGQDLSDELERVIRRFLDDLWRAGALEGRTAAEAYTVRCEGPTTAGGFDDGRLVVEIGLLPPWPAEFVIIRIDLSHATAKPLSDGMGNRAFDR